MRNRKNKNLSITKKDTFRGLPILQAKEGMVINYLDKIYDTFDNALSDHPRTMAVRVDLRLPLFSSGVSGDVMKRFIASLKAQIDSYLKRKKKNNKRVRQCNVRYVWVKERNTALSQHYHLVLLFNNDVYNTLGRFGNRDNLSYRIQRAWCSAVDKDMDEGARLVHFPENPTYYADRNSDDFDEQLSDLFERASYLAKAETKEYGDRSRSFGCSRR
jgi:hypothetical protein